MCLVAPGFLQNPEVRRWLNGVEPAWTALDFDSYCSLREEPSSTNRAIRLEPNLGTEEVAGSAVARNANILLRRAAEPDGLKLTATGNLSRAVVDEMVQLFDWPNYDKDELHQFNKVINEPDFLPLHFVRVLTALAKLARKRQGTLVATQLGKRLLGNGRQGSLQAFLFHVAFWHLNLAYFGRGSIESWPQIDIGVVLWSLSAAANEWLPAETLTRLCTVPVNGVVEATWDLGSAITEGRILRPLVWFGLLEHRSETPPGTGLISRHLYRKAPLFDRFLKFRVGIEGPDIRH